MSGPNARLLRDETDALACLRQTIRQLALPVNVSRVRHTERLDFLETAVLIQSQIPMTWPSSATYGCTPRMN